MYCVLCKQMQRYDTALPIVDPPSDDDIGLRFKIGASYSNGMMMDLSGLDYLPMPPATVMIYDVEDDTRGWHHVDKRASGWIGESSDGTFQLGAEEQGFLKKWEGHPSSKPRTKLEAIALQNRRREERRCNREAAFDAQEFMHM